MIYADPSFLASLYGWDSNTQRAQDVYAKDGRRPLFFTPWQHFEVRNALRLALQRVRRAGGQPPYQTGIVFRRIDEDLSAGRLKHVQPDWQDAFRLAEEFSQLHTGKIGCASSDIWHVATANLLGADTFWTFDADQHALAVAVGCFRRSPKLTV